MDELASGFSGVGYEAHTVIVQSELKPGGSESQSLHMLLPNGFQSNSSKHEPPQKKATIASIDIIIGEYIFEKIMTPQDILESAPMLQFRMQLVIHSSLNSYFVTCYDHGENIIQTLQ
ncbi:unnamed protein product, partial [Sphenostylis stenocarpa]